MFDEPTPCFDQRAGAALTRLYLPVKIGMRVTREMSLWTAGMKKCMIAIGGDRAIAPGKPACSRSNIGPPGPSSMARFAIRTLSRFCMRTVQIEALLLPEAGGDEADLISSRAPE